MTILIIFVILMAVVFVVLKKYFPDIFNEKEEVSKSPYNYKKKDFLMSRPEHEFFDILVEVIGNQYYVFPQIHLSTILDNKTITSNGGTDKRTGTGATPRAPSRDRPTATRSTRSA